MQRNTNTRSPRGFWHAPPSMLKLFRMFPLIEHPSQLLEGSGSPARPTLWILASPSSSSNASYDVRSLSRQASLLFRGVSHELKCWATEDGGPGGRLPALHLPDGTLLADDAIETWLDKEHPLPEVDESILNEAAAWYALIETKLYPALIAHLFVEPLFDIYTIPLYHPRAKASTSPLFSRLVHTLVASSHQSAELANVKAIVGASGVVEVEDLEAEAADALESLAVRLGQREEGAPEWFLGTRCAALDKVDGANGSEQAHHSSPLPLDAALYAHIHALLALPGLKTSSPRTSNKLRTSVERQKNLVAWTRNLERKYCT